MRKKIIISILLGLMCVGIGGCGMNKQEKTEQGFVSYMEEKYNEDFTFIELVGSHMGSSVREAYVKSASFPNERIWVEVSESENGTSIYRDNFMGYYYQSEIQTMIQDTMAEQFSGGKAEYIPFQSVIVGSSDTPETLEELLKQSDTMLSVMIKADSISPDRDYGMELWREKLKEKQLRLNGKIEVAGESESCFFAMDSFYEYNYVNWR